jgi:hypothetical protein
VLTRPETLPFAAATAVAITHGARSLGTLASLGRSIGPTALGVGGQALCNQLLTGEWAPAGAVRKLLTSSPWADTATVAVAALTNAVVLIHQGVVRALGGWPLAALPLGLALVALGGSRHRRLVLALWIGAVGSLALVCLNDTARYQNYRYASPTLLMVLCAVALGAHALGSHRRLRPLAWLLALGALFAPAGQLRGQARHFAQASVNILEQHGEVARRLRALSPPPRRILIGDAGTIPYLSELPPLDGLGLGGYRGLPFARASVHGLPAVVELIERLPEAQRPDLMALYPGWWVGLADVFGRPIDRVAIRDNVICAADEKVIYASDWSTLASSLEERAGAVDTLDVADLVSEREHAYAFERPGSGRVVAATLADAEGRRRYDGGRAIASGEQQSFVVAAAVARGPATLVLRTDAAAAVVQVTVQGAAPLFGGSLEPGDSGEGWQEIRLALPEVGGGDRIRLRPQEGELRTFHLWLLRP